MELIIYMYIHLSIAMNARSDGLVTALLHYSEPKHNGGGVTNMHRVTNLFE